MVDLNSLLALRVGGLGGCLWLYLVVYFLCVGWLLLSGLSWYDWYVLNWWFCCCRFALDFGCNV